MASLTGPLYEDMFPGTGRGRRRASGTGMGRRGNPNDVTGKPWNVLPAITRSISVVNASEALGEAGVRRYMWLKPLRTSSMSVGRR
eukprot:5462136-Pyramimonas_sp.AAC.1